MENKMLMAFSPSFASSASHVAWPFQVQVLASSATITLFSAMLSSEVLFMLWLK